MRYIIIVIMCTLSYGAVLFDPITVGISPYTISTGGFVPVRPDGAYSGLYNPSLLKLTNYNQARLFYTTYEDVYSTNIGGLFQTKYFPIAFTYTGLGVKNINSTYLDINGNAQEGSSVVYRSDLFTIGTTYDFFGIPSGVTLKAYRSVIDTNNVTAFNANIGSYTYIINDLLVGGYIENVFTFLSKAKWSSGYEEYLPTSFAIGVYYKLGSLGISFNNKFYDIANNMKCFWSMGFSYKVAGLSINGSYNKDELHFNNIYYSLGLSLDLDLFSVGSCIVPSNFYGGGYTQYFDTSFNFDSGVFNKTNENKISIVTKNIVIESITNNIKERSVPTINVGADLFTKPNKGVAPTYEEITVDSLNDILKNKKGGNK